MNAKIMVLKVLKSKPKPMKNIKMIEETIEEIIPNMYEFIYGIGEDDALKQVDQHQPEIVFMYHTNSMDILGTLKKIKQLHPLAAVFIFLPTVDNEQELFDEYMNYGAYKCYLIPPLNIDTMIHDMYVALNLE